ncbi:bacteriocin immunity protein [Pseudomonas sp. Teo4]|uniref:bacteriocin immunity protein n=1 Tax=Pseudomonas sp. Teo4 TaxID=3064528 RepID=UPI002ABBD399|nr:bacteriocin immunity protein [Pseudomonas sp. Teo4]MDZ3991117.1 Pyocin-S2 immunity protein [Pseudomonas sp. Teo4]
MKKTIADFTETEFLNFVIKIYEVDYPTDKTHTDAIFEFERLSEHPKKSDLIFYPDHGKSGPASIVEEVKSWRLANGKPGFKTE